MGFAQKGGRVIAVTMASAKKVRRQKILKIFYLNVLVEPKELLCGRPCEKSPVERNAFCLRGIVYGELSAPIGGNVWQACAVRFMKLPVSARRNVY